MKILAFDSSFDSCSVSLFKENKIFFIQKNCKNNHSEILFPIIKKILLKNNTNLSEINFIAFCGGPGKFTGTRISTNIAQGFSIALKIPLIQVSCLKIIAQEALKKNKNEKNFFVIMQVNKKQYYFSKYSLKNINIITEKKAICINKKNLIKKILNTKKKSVFAGNFNKKKLKLNNNNIHKNVKILFPNAKYMIPIALHKINQKKISDPELTVPKYLHNF